MGRDIRSLADGLRLTMYHVRVVRMLCVPLSSLRGSDPPKFKEKEVVLAVRIFNKSFDLGLQSA